METYTTMHIYGREHWFSGGLTPLYELNVEIFPTGQHTKGVLCQEKSGKRCFAVIITKDKLTPTAELFDIEINGETGKHYVDGDHTIIGV